jgi:hypothetical protein
MYDLNLFERGLAHFGSRVEIICAMEMGGKLSEEDAYKQIKSELKKLKKIRKNYKEHKNERLQ